MKKRKKAMLVSLIASIVVIGIILLIVLTNINKSDSQQNYDIEFVLNRAIQDEYKAEATYEKVISEYGEVRPFTSIVNAEVKHSEAIKRLYDSYGLTVPDNNWENSDDIPSFDSIEDACQAGVQAEIENIEIYDELLKNNIPDNIYQVFTSNRRASEENHLPAFQRCS